MANPTTLSWKGPTTYTDGKPYGQADHGGYDIELNGQVLLSIPFAWNTANTYSFPVADLPVKQGTNAVRLRTVASNGQVSVWTAPVSFPYASIPSEPTALTVA